MAVNSPGWIIQSPAKKWANAENHVWPPWPPDKKRRQRRGKQKGITMGLITKLFGTRSEREVKKIEPIIAKIEALAAPSTRR